MADFSWRNHQMDALKYALQQGIIKSGDAGKFLRDFPAESQPPSYTHSAKPTNRKVQLALDRAIEQLPIRLANKIHVIRFGPDGSDDPHFEVIFKSGKVVTFEDVDHFPTDADIARIAVECP
jgi:hypothetical protein